MTYSSEGFCQFLRAFFSARFEGSRASKWRRKSYLYIYFTFFSTFRSLPSYQGGDSGPSEWERALE